MEASSSPQVADLPEHIQLRILSLLAEPSLTASTPVQNKETTMRQQRKAEASVLDIDGGQGCCVQIGENRITEAMMELYEKGVTVVENAFGAGVLAAARADADTYGSTLTSSTMGGRLGPLKWQDQALRGDRSAWLKLPRLQEQGQQGLATVLTALEALRPALGKAGFNVAGTPSFQLACYQGGGASYVKHRDRSRSCPHRAVTAIYYLNPGWDPAQHGGQLRLFLELPQHRIRPGSEVTVQKDRQVEVAPLGDRLVIFQSHLEHEVLPAYATRYAVTAWFSEGQQDKPIADLVISRSEPTFFISIACFRDRECHWTLRDLFRKADHPERLSVGVVWQINAEQDADFANLGTLTLEERARVKELKVDYRKATGPCWARHEAQKLWAGEDYFLQIDSHMRFVQGWDTKLLSMHAFASQSSPKPVLTGYPPGYEGLGPAAVVPGSQTHPVILCAREFGPDKLLRLSGRVLKARQEPGKALPSLFWAAGFSFSSARLIQEVPYDPALPYLFFGEEQSMAVRMFTHGWDFFIPSEPVVFHLWSRKYRPVLSPEQQEQLEERLVSQSKVLALLCRSTGPYVCPHCKVQFFPVKGKYGLGSQRSVEDYYRHCGVDFCLQNISKRAEHGGLTDPDSFLSLAL